MLITETREIRHFHVCCGAGGGAKGFKRANPRVGSMAGLMRCIGGVDVDPAGIRDFERASGVKGTVLDLFDRDQYRDFHGKEPDSDWREATADDLRRAAGYETPHIVFASFPCKGFSGLLSEKASGTKKYQALNRLTLRGVWLIMEAWKDDPVDLFIFENVPRIATRGRYLLDQIVGLLRAYGYATAETGHDCGELGGLAQSRKRFLLVARHTVKVPPFLYEPPKKKLRGVGEILGRMPLPGDDRAGPMHRIPSLQWQTWVRLAFVKAGSDWRSLRGLAITEDGNLRDYLIVPEMRSGVLGVNEWDAPMGTVAGRSTPTNGQYAVADVRHFWYGDHDPRGPGVRAWDQPAVTVTGQRSPMQGANSVADPRFAQSEKWTDGAQYGVNAWDQPSPTIAGQQSPGQGRYSVADPRHDGAPMFSNLYRIVRWDNPARAVTGAHSSGQCVADPRGQADMFHNAYKLTEWHDPAGAVTAQHAPSNGGGAVADPRPHNNRQFDNSYQVADWGRPAKTVIGRAQPSDGGLSVADPRVDDRRSGACGVLDWREPAGTVAGESLPSNGNFAVADPRSHTSFGGVGKYGVTGWEEATGTVIGASSTGHGATAVADPRPGMAKEKGDAYLTAGHYGVLSWGSPAMTVSGSACHDNGFNSVADPRLPAATDRLVCVIRALDGTWHRPFTTLELAALQSLVDPQECWDGTFAMDGKADSSHRERIGNAVPPDSARAIAETMGRTLLLAWSGERFFLSGDKIWVRPLEVALSVDTSEQLPKEAAA